MIREIARFSVQSASSDSSHTVAVRIAQSGPHSGEAYLNCTCPGGRYAFSPMGYRPCKHVREIAVNRLHVTLVDGHFAQIAAALVSQVAA